MMETTQIKSELFTIQQVARKSSLTAHTLRYYERAGLMLEPISRNNSSGVRFYTQQDLSWIIFLKCLRATGMPIRDVRRYVELLRQGSGTEAERVQLLKQHQAHIIAQLSEAQQFLAAITSKITRYEAEQSARQPAAEPYRETYEMIEALI